MLPKYKAKSNEFLLKTFQTAFFNFLKENYPYKIWEEFNFTTVDYSIHSQRSDRFHILLKFPVAKVFSEIVIQADDAYSLSIYVDDTPLRNVVGNRTLFKGTLTSQISHLYSACKDIYFMYPNKSGGTFYTRDASVVEVHTAVRTYLFARNSSGELLLRDEFPSLT